MSCHKHKTAPELSPRGTADHNDASNSSIGGYTQLSSEVAPNHSQVRQYLLMQGIPGDRAWVQGVAEFLALAVGALDAANVDLAIAHLDVLRGELLKVSPTYHAEIEARRLICLWSQAGRQLGVTA